MSVGLFGAWNVSRGRTGRALLVIKDSEIAAGSLGIHAARYKVIAFAISAFYAAIAGGLFAYLVRYINPENFSVGLSISFLSMVVIGGLGTIGGSIVGAAFYVIVPELLRGIKDAPGLVFGLLLVIVMVFMPQGLWGMVRRLWRRSWDDAPCHRKCLGRFRRHSRAEGRQLRARVRLHRRTDRPERRRQEHAAQLHLRHHAADPGPGPARRDGSLGVSASTVARQGIGRVFQHPELVTDLSVHDNLLIACHRSLDYGLVSELLRLPNVRRQSVPRPRGSTTCWRGSASPIAPTRDPQSALRPSQADRSRPRAADGHPLPAARRADRRPERRRDRTLGEMLLGLRQEFGLGILVVEHNMPFVSRLCDRLVVLDLGQLIANGPPADVLGDPRVMASYLGEVADA